MAKGKGGKGFGGKGFKGFGGKDWNQGGKDWNQSGGKGGDWNQKGLHYWGGESETGTNAWCSSEKKQKSESKIESPPGLSKIQNNRSSFFEEKEQEEVEKAQIYVDLC